MRIIIFLVLVYILIYADTSLEIKKGWQLIGISSSLNIQEKFDNENVDVLWVFDALTQSWAGVTLPMKT